MLVRKLDVVVRKFDFPINKSNLWSDKSNLDFIGDIMGPPEQSTGKCTASTNGNAPRGKYGVRIFLYLVKGVYYVRKVVVSTAKSTQICI